MNRGHPRRDLMLGDHVARVFIVRAILDHELHLIVRPQAIEIAPVVLPRLAAAWTLDVEDRDDALGHARRAAVPAGLEQHGASAPEQRIHERVHLFLQQRLAARDFDELAFYAEHFNTVEVNTTFYGQPRPEVTRGWAVRTPSTFDFSLKLYQKFTHPKMFRDAALKRAPGSEGPLLDLLAQVTQPDIDEFRAGIDPLASSGK